MRNSGLSCWRVTLGVLGMSLLVNCHAVASNHPLDEIGLAQARQFFAGADALAGSAGEPLTRGVYAQDTLLGYLFFSDSIAPIPAYSGRPIRTLVGLGLDARIRGAQIVKHEEPILVIGITDNDLARFTQQYRNLDARTRVRIGAFNRPGYTGVDGITGATITAMVLNSSILQSARLVADAYALPRQAVTRATVVPEQPPITTAAKRRATTSAPEPSPTTAPEINTASLPVWEPPEQPLWLEIWQQQAVQLALLVIALTVLLAILFFQDWLVVHAVLFQRVRVGYLLFTVFFLGLYTKAQLSVINLVAFMRVLFGGFTWDTLLIDPMIFILWGFVAVSIILWGRGVFCGWLCPFGALQELLHKIAERLQLPSYEFPPMVHERLWAIKYFILIALVGLSLESMTYAALLVEVEPFKTTFVMRFNREIWFIAYALILLAISIFNSKFYCKYLCPLGAALSFFTRFRVFDWLRRRRECGQPCQSCATQCQISAIKPTGEIIDNECHYCLECQVTYWDEQRCPPLVEKRKKREVREQRAGGIIASS